jgi:hypothetical protein
VFTDYDEAMSMVRHWNKVLSGVGGIKLPFTIAATTVKPALDSAALPLFDEAEQ